jgi:hypothetical protein
MRASNCSVFAVFLLALTAAAQLQAPASAHVRVGPEVIGIVHKEIADSSPVAFATLHAEQNPVKVGSIIPIHFTLENRSDHDLKLFGGFPEVDIRDKDGKIAPETAFGCGDHFFSPCHTAPGHSTRGPLRGAIPVHGRVEDEIYPGPQYNLAPGTYTVVGYVCAVQEGPECFKTNTITITVVAALPESPAECPEACASEVIGVCHKEIADSSPVVSVTLQAIPNPVMENSAIRVHFVAENRSGHDVHGGIYPILDVRDSDGNLAPETEAGRAGHFFSPCHTLKWLGGGWGQQDVLPVHGKKEDDTFLYQAYDLGPGTYTVVGYVCGVQEGPECFKTNTLTITVVPNPSDPDTPRIGPMLIGAFHSHMAVSSPFASATLRAVVNPVKAGSAIMVHFTIENLSNSDLVVSDNLFPVFDVRDRNGKIATETTNGRGVHFFSPCYTGQRQPWSPYPAHGIIPAHGRRDGDGYISGEYQLPPGTYTVVGYVCGILDGPECFMTNTITITVE